MDECHPIPVILYDISVHSHMGKIHFANNKRPENPCVLPGGVAVAVAAAITVVRWAKKLH